MLGFHPNNDGFIELSGYILEQLPVIPPCARYYSEFDGVKEPSPLTVSYQNIIKNLAKVPNNINNDYINVMNDIYYYVKGLYTNITELVKGKDGYIRGFTMSKRNDFSGRSVLNPYNTLKFGYVAYPSIMRKFHTIPVKLTDFNYTQMTEFLKNNQVIRVIGGPNSPKPSKIITVTKQFLNVYTPQIGDTFELQGQDGDETMFNRQPTLDKYAIMGYKAHYVEDWNYLCIGLLSPYNTPHNSDYDGDQGNKLKIQTLHGRSEIRQFVGVENCMMNTNSNKPTMGMVYNSVTSAYLMTSSDEEISPKYWEYFFSFLQSRDDVDSLKERLDLNGMPEYTGKALFSALLPDDFHYDRRRNENDTQSVYIRNGILVQGIITSKDIGPSPNSIFHYMWKEYDRERMTRFFTEAQHILDEYLEYYGFSIGMKSVLMEDHHRIEAIVAQTIEMSKAKISALGLDREDETFLEKEIRESKVSGYVNTVSRIGVTIGNNVLPKFNAIRVMNTSGAKGKDTNTAQIIGALGQQYILGQRPKLEITKGTRYLPYYEPNSTDIESRGFIKESFLTGANPGGFIAHMAASRVGLMDTALKTGEIGYLHHRIVKVTEDVTINYDGSIRNTDGKILSYSYDGGFSTAAIIKTKNDATGEVLSFTDVKATAAKLDAQLDVGK